MNKFLKKTKKANKNFHGIFVFALFGAIFYGILFLPYSVLSDDVTSQNSATPLSDAQKQVLRNQLRQLNQQIDALNQQITQTQSEQRTIKNEISAISLEIQRTQLSIERSEKIIAQIDDQISAVEKKIAEEELKIAQERDVIASLLNSINEQDNDISMAAIIFSGKSLSDIANEISANANVQENLLGQINSVRVLEGRLNEEKQKLDDQKAQQEQAREILLIARDDLNVKVALQGQLLSQSFNKQQNISNQLSQVQQTAAGIRAQLYTLEDIGKSIAFGDAYAMAKQVAQKTGVRPAFLLAVLQKESHLGSFIGTGYWKTDMHPRDWQAFIQITQELGLDPDKVPVSKKPSYGWGGAMGPAQFLPTTWLSYKPRISALTGDDPPSPWDIKDAMAAAGLKLTAGGADAKTYNAEWKAAMIYFAGSNWNNPAYAFYGDSVEDLAAAFQNDINVLENKQ